MLLGFLRQTNLRPCHARMSASGRPALSAACSLHVAARAEFGQQETVNVAGQGPRKRSLNWHVARLVGNWKRTDIEKCATARPGVNIRPPQVRIFNISMSTRCHGVTNSERSLYTCRQDASNRAAVSARRNGTLGAVLTRGFLTI